VTGCAGDSLIYIPDVVGDGPALILCSTDPIPGGYSVADQVCAQDRIDNDPFCIDTNWDQICQDAYDACVNPPIADVGNTTQTKALEDELVDLSIYPNPNDGIGLTVIIKAEKNVQRRAELRLFDVTGKLLTSERLELMNKNSRIDLNFHPRLMSGVYMLEFTIGDDSYRERVIVR
jgi:hypothetical protein